MRIHDLKREAIRIVRMIQLLWAGTFSKVEKYEIYMSYQNMTDFMSPAGV